MPNQVRQYSDEVADWVDGLASGVADVVREQLAALPWLPDPMRPPPPPPPRVAVVPMSACERVQEWAARHKLLAAAVVLGAGYCTYHQFVRSSRWSRRTGRARRARNGARLEVVVVAGSPALPLTKSLSLHLERRGFVVYVVCGSIEEEVLVQNLSRPDIKALSIDITDVSALCAFQTFFPQRERVCVLT